MRLLLDAHFSAKRIAEPLRKAGYDVLALCEEPTLDGLTDAQVLELAAEQGRILITRNARDFAPLLRVWADKRRHHAGCILVWGLRHDQFGPIRSGIEELLSDNHSSAKWKNIVRAI